MCQRVEAGKTSLFLLSILLLSVSIMPILIVGGDNGLQRVAVGIYPGGKNIWEYEADLSVSFNHVLQFQSIRQLDYARIVALLDRGYDVILNVEFQDSFANLYNVTAGMYDAYLVDLCNSIKADGRTIWIRTLHEFNGDWYNWGVLYPGNRKEDFVPAWRHVVQLFRDQGTPVKFQLNYNTRNGKDDPTLFSAFWPGDEWVDMTVITNYNRAGTDKWHPDTAWREFKNSFTYPYNQISPLTTKPIGVAETSSTSHGGDKAQWIINTFNSIVSDFPRVSQVTWFLRNKVVDGKSWDWDLNTPEDKDSFRRGMDLVTGGGSLFGDSFNSNYFNEWDGVYKTLGEWCGRTSARVHEWNYSAKFTSNGTPEYESAYCYRNILSAGWLSARSYVYVLDSGIRADSERMAFIMARGKSSNVLFAGWRMTGGQVKWYLSTRDGAGYRTVYSQSTPSLNRWYGMTVEWTIGTSGGAALKIDGIEACRTVSDTTGFGMVIQVRFGLAETYNCSPSTMYVDCCALSSR